MADLGIHGHPEIPEESLQKAQTIPPSPTDRKTTSVAGNIFFGKPTAAARAAQIVKPLPPPPSLSKQQAQLLETQTHCLEEVLGTQAKTEKSTDLGTVLAEIKPKPPLLVKLHDLMEEAKTIDEDNKDAKNKVLRDVLACMNAPNMKELSKNLESKKAPEEAEHLKEILDDFSEEFCNFVAKPTVANDKTAPSYKNSILIFNRLASILPKDSPLKESLQKTLEGNGKYGDLIQQGKTAGILKRAVRTNREITETIDKWGSSRGKLAAKLGKHTITLGGHQKTAQIIQTHLENLRKSADEFKKIEEGDPNTATKEKEVLKDSLITFINSKGFRKLLTKNPELQPNLARTIATLCKTDQDFANFKDTLWEKQFLDEPTDKESAAIDDAIDVATFMDTSKEISLMTESERADFKEGVQRAVKKEEALQQTKETQDNIIRENLLIKQLSTPQKEPLTKALAEITLKKQQTSRTAEKAEGKKAPTSKDLKAMLNTLFTETNSKIKKNIVDIKSRVSGALKNKSAKLLETAKYLKMVKKSETGTTEEISAKGKIQKTTSQWKFSIKKDVIVFGNHIITLGGHRNTTQAIQNHLKNLRKSANKLKERKKGAPKREAALQDSLEKLVSCKGFRKLLVEEEPEEEVSGFLIESVLQNALAETITTLYKTEEDISNALTRFRPDQNASFFDDQESSIDTPEMECIERIIQLALYKKGLPPRPPQEPKEPITGKIPTKSKDFFIPAGKVPKSKATPSPLPPHDEEKAAPSETKQEWQKAEPGEASPREGIIGTRKPPLPPRNVRPKPPPPPMPPPRNKPTRTPPPLPPRNKPTGTPPPLPPRNEPIERTSEATPPPPPTGESAEGIKDTPLSQEEVERLQRTPTGSDFFTDLSPAETEALVQEGPVEATPPPLPPPLSEEVEQLGEESPPPPRKAPTEEALKKGFASFKKGPTPEQKTESESLMQRKMRLRRQSMEGEETEPLPQAGPPKPKIPPPPIPTSTESKGSTTKKKETPEIKPDLFAQIRAGSKLKKVAKKETSETGKPEKKTSDETAEALKRNEKTKKMLEEAKRKQAELEEAEKKAGEEEEDWD